MKEYQIAIIILIITVVIMYIIIKICIKEKINEVHDYHQNCNSYLEIYDFLEDLNKKVELDCKFYKAIYECLNLKGLNSVEKKEIVAELERDEQDDMDTYEILKKLLEEFKCKLAQSMRNQYLNISYDLTQTETDNRDMFMLEKIIFNYKELLDSIKNRQKLLKRLKEEK